MKPIITFMLKKNYEIDLFLRSVDLYNLIDDDGNDVIAMWRALVMMRYLAVKEGIDVPLRIVEDDACFAPMRDMLLPGSRTVESVFQSAVAAVPIHFSHFVMRMKIVGSGNLEITGEFLIPCHRNDVHLAQLYLIATIQRICKECLPREEYVFEHIGICKPSQGFDHLKEARFGKIVERNDRKCVVSIRSCMLQRVLGSGCSAARRRSMEDFRKPEGDLCSAFLAIGEGMDGNVSFARMAAATNTSQEKLRRLAKRYFSKSNDLVAVTEYHKQLRRVGRPLSWRVVELSCSFIPYFTQVDMKVSSARSYARTGEI